MKVRHVLTLEENDMWDITGDGLGEDDCIFIEHASGTSTLDCFCSAGCFGRPFWRCPVLRLRIGSISPPGTSRRIQISRWRNLTVATKMATRELDVYEAELYWSLVRVMLAERRRRREAAVALWLGREGVDWGEDTNFSAAEEIMG